MRLALNRLHIFVLYFLFDEIRHLHWLVRVLRGSFHSAVVDWRRSKLLLLLRHWRGTRRRLDLCLRGLQLLLGWGRWLVGSLIVVEEVGVLIAVVSVVVLPEPLVVE